MLTKRSVWCGAAFVVGLGATLAISAGPRESKDDGIERVAQNEKASRQEITGPVTQLSEIAYNIDDGGFMEVAGVIGFSVDADGSFRIIAKAGGDFGTDPTLRIPVQLWQLEDGSIGAGVQSVREMPGRVEMVVHAVPSGSVAAAANGCEGVQLPSGEYSCVNTTCIGACPVNTDTNGLKTCANCTPAN